MTSMSERYRRWFRYEKDVHGATIRSLATVPEARRAQPGFQKAIDLVAHIATARALWLYRFGVASEGPSTVEDLFPKGVPLESLEGRLAAVESAWASYFSELDEEELGRVFEYRSTEGLRYRNRVEDLLTQLFGHSWYHRGQVAALVRGLGGEPAETDFVFWTRERVD